MTKKSFKSNFKNLSQNKKLVFIGSFLALVCVFLPWYSDLDRFGTGDVFLGISGPLYLAGILVLTLAVVNLGIIGFQILKKEIRLPVEEKYFFLSSGIISSALQLLALSVFFHSKFGLNVVEKSLGFGLVIGFMASFLIFLGGVLITKEVAPNIPTIENLDLSRMRKRTTDFKLEREKSIAELENQANLSENEVNVIK